MRLRIIESVKGGRFVEVRFQKFTTYTEALEIAQDQLKIVDLIKSNGTIVVRFTHKGLVYG